MFKKLLPKEDKYFDDFKEMITHIQEMASLTHQLFSADKPDKDLLLKLRTLEHRCDEVSAKVIKRLNKTFITPFDREDILVLTQKLDDIGDMLLAASIRIDLFNVTEKIKYADDLAAIVLQQIKELGIALNDLRVKHTNECKAVAVLETEADKVYHQAMKELFIEEKDPLNVIRRKDILSILEEASDKSQAAANVILSIFIKNA
ncbi:MAG TPA: DUF47 family protein [Ignavibacteriaceae bacterium]|nr:DUF47 family protein [Ignavibacteriaceae bacterium]